MVGGVAAVVTLPGIGVNTGVLRERTERLRDGALKRGVGSIDAGRDRRRRTHLAVENNDALRHGSELGENAGAESVVLQELGLEVLTHHSAVADFSDHGTLDLALNGEVEVVERGQLGGFITLEPGDAGAVRNGRV